MSYDVRDRRHAVSELSVQLLIIPLLDDDDEKEFELPDSLELLELLDPPQQLQGPLLTDQLVTTSPRVRIRRHQISAATSHIRDNLNAPSRHAGR